MMQDPEQRKYVILLGGLVTTFVGAGLLFWLSRGNPDPSEVVQPARVSQLEAEPAASVDRDRTADRVEVEVTPQVETTSAPVKSESTVLTFEGPEGQKALRKLRLDEIDRNWEQVVVARERDYKGDLLKVNTLVLTAMKPILDEAGLGEKQVGTRYSYPADKHYLFINGLDYFVPHGQFPVLDRYIYLWQDWSARSEAAREHDPWVQLPFMLDEPFLISLEAMKNQALEALERRAELY